MRIQWRENKLLANKKSFKSPLSNLQTSRECALFIFNLTPNPVRHGFRLKFDTYVLRSDGSGIRFYAEPKSFSWRRDERVRDFPAVLQRIFIDGFHLEDECTAGFFFLDGGPVSCAVDELRLMVILDGQSWLRVLCELETKRGKNHISEQSK